MLIELKHIYALFDWKYSPAVHKSVFDMRSKLKRC
jgi:hypothetical protein